MARTVVGLDIGSSGVRAAEFAIGRRTTTLQRYAEVELPAGVIRAGTVADPDALTEALKELWARGRFRTKAVVLGVANDAVLVRQMDLEWMPPADFRQALRYQVADSLPVPVDEANLDYYLLEEVELPAEGKEAARRVARVMLVAAGREMVDGFVRALHAARLRPIRVDLLPFALVRAVSPTVTAPDTPLEAVVDIGADTVVVVVHQGGRPRFVRTIAGHGGDVITQALMERYEWDREDAERTKVVLGMPGHTRLDLLEGDLEEAPDPDELAEHPAHQVIAQHVEAMISEIRATLVYFRGSVAEEQRLSRVVLTGSAARLGGLAEAMSENLDRPVEHLDVLARIKTSRRLRPAGDEVAALAVTAGLCLGVPTS